MNATKSLVTGAVALTAFASVLGLAYAQVETTDPNAQTQQQQYPSTQTDPTQAAPAEQSMTPADPSASAAEQSQSQQMQTESQSQQTQPQSTDQWQNQQQPATQDPLPSEPTAAGTPAPRADRN